MTSIGPMNIVVYSRNDTNVPAESGATPESSSLGIANAHTAIADASDERLLGQWKLLQGGEEILTMPRIAVVKSFVVNHMIHHRAQLGVYLRLNDIAVPSVYGSTADEAG